MYYTYRLSSVGVAGSVLSTHLGLLSLPRLPPADLLDNFLGHVLGSCFEGMCIDMSNKSKTISTLSLSHSDSKSLQGLGWVILYNSVTNQTYRLSQKKLFWNFWGGERFSACSDFPCDPHKTWRQFLLDKNEQRFCFSQVVGFDVRIPNM